MIITDKHMLADVNKSGNISRQGSQFDCTMHTSNHQATNPDATAPAAAAVVLPAAPTPAAAVLAVLLQL